MPECQYSDSNEVLEAIKKVNPELTDIINNCDKSIHAPVWNTEKTTAHHAIIPTSSDNLGACSKMWDQNVLVLSFLIHASVLRRSTGL